jgi:hypothetical protein
MKYSGAARANEKSLREDPAPQRKLRFFVLSPQRKNNNLTVAMPLAQA